jgi:hypothetical protein
MARLPGESEEDYAIRTGVTKQMIEQVTTALNELDQLQVGFTVDQKSNTAYFDFEATAVEGTATAEKFAQMKTAKTNFAGFDIPGAALTASWASTLADSDVERAKANIANLRTAALEELKNQDLSKREVELASELLSDLLDVAEKTVENKQLDGGMVLLLEPDADTFATGGLIVDGAKLDKIIRKLADEAQKEEPDISKLLELDAAEHQGVHFHTLSLPLEEIDDSEPLMQVFGETLDLVIGLDERSVYLAVGNNSLSTLKQVIDRSKAEENKEILPMRISLAATPIAEFIATVAEEDSPVGPMAAGIAQMLGQSDGKDHLTLTSEPIPGGVRTRLEIEEGLLKMIGPIAQLVGAAAAGGPGAMPVPDANEFHDDF